MQLQLVLVLFGINFCTISTENSPNRNPFLRTTDKSDLDDTPSPEWIKYQQQRYQNSDKLSAIYGKSLISRTQPKMSTAPKVGTSRTITTSRQASSQHEENNSSNDFEKPAEDKITSTVEFPSIKGFIEFIKSFKQNWMKKSLFRLEDKIKMLYQLKDSLLKTIEQQFMILWQGDEDDENLPPSTRKSYEGKGGSYRRTKRGILDESNINFPPNAALMSINFLTFAVFLIKLVLQVVNIVKTKHYQFSTLNMDSDAIRNG